MKKLLLGLMVFVLSIAGSAQEHVVKLDLYKTLSLYPTVGYEYVLADNFTLGMSIGAKIPRDLGTTYTQFASFAGIDYNSLSGKANGFFLMPEARLYTGNDAPDGFYISFLTSYTRNAISLNANAYDDIDQRYYDYDVNLYMQRIKFNVALGTQWLIADVVTIDWTYIGLGLMHLTYGGKVESDNPDVYDEADLLETQEDIRSGSTLMNNFTIETDGKETKFKLGMLWPALHTGLKIGIAF